MAAASREILKIDDEVKIIDQQLKELKQRKRKLLEQKTQLQRVVENHVTASNSASKSWESETFPWSGKLRASLLDVFKMNDFRPLQLSAINACLSGEDVLLIMSTGGGKSLCYQLPAVISDGLALVVSPLISLMDDQAMALQNFEVEAAVFSQQIEQKEQTKMQNAMADKENRTLKLVYATPEKLAKSKRFVAKLEKCYEAGRLKLIAVDEVHCCSQWGHDFRVDYKFLNVLKRQYPNTPILGLTATAGNRVIDDVKSMLNIPAALVFRAGFNRPNLFYEVRHKPNENASFVDDVRKLIQERFRDQSGIIYCLSKKEADELTEVLSHFGFRVGCYHADVDVQQRSKIHKKWTSNDYQIMVATVAFGMGIDKPNVRFVIHHSLPKSMENYYQESGRAGRDGERSTCLLYFRYGDVFRQSTMVCTERTGLENLYSMVSYCQTASTECRRAVIAKHFGETWDPSWCDKMCDNCRQKAGGEENGEPSVNIDISDYCRVFLRLIKNSESKLTGLKLMELFLKEQRTSKIAAPLQREKAEHVVLRLLLDGYLKEDFHFTPYSIISYITAGARAAFFKDDDVIFMDFPAFVSEFHGDRTCIKKAPKKKRKIEKRPVEEEEDEDSDPLEFEIIE